MSNWAGPGDYLTREILDEPIFVIRSKDGGVRAFANTCRHRGTRLLDGDDNVRSAIKCRWYAWTYGFDGALLGWCVIGSACGRSRSTVTTASSS